MTHGHDMPPVCSTLRPLITESPTYVRRAEFANAFTKGVDTHMLPSGHGDLRWSYKQLMMLEKSYSLIVCPLPLWERAAAAVP